jgi:hypothetical protein
MGNDQTPVTTYINNNAYRLTKDIMEIFAYINTVAGVNVITHKTATKTGVPHPVFDIVDTDLQKQERIKQIRDANKALNLTKDEVANRVWKYRYIPPALESNYFERNLGDNKELTKIRQLHTTDGFKRKDVIEPQPENWVRPQITSSYLA